MKRSLLTWFEFEIICPYAIPLTSAGLPFSFLHSTAQCGVGLLHVTATGVSTPRAGPSEEDDAVADCCWYEGQVGIDCYFVALRSYLARCTFPGC